MGSSFRKNGYNDPAPVQGDLVARDNQTSTKRPLLKVSDFSQKKVSEVEFMIQSLRLHKGYSRVPIDFRLLTVKTTCLKQKSYVLENFNVQSLFETSESIIINELRSECSRYSSINMFATQFSSIYFIFSEICSDENEHKLNDLKQNLCLMLDNHINKPSQLMLFYITKSRVSREDVFQDFIGNMHGEPAIFTHNELLNEIKDPPELLAEEINLSSESIKKKKKETKSSFKKKQVDFGDFLLSKPQLTSQSPTSDRNDAASKHILNSGASSSNINQATYENSASNNNSKATTNKKLHSHFDVNKLHVNTELCSIKETRETKNLVSKRTKPQKKLSNSKYITGLREKVRKSSFKQQSVNNAKVLFDSNINHTNLKYIITLNLKDFAIKGEHGDYSHQVKDVSSKKVCDSNDNRTVNIKNKSPKHKFVNIPSNNHYKENSGDFSTYPLKASKKDTGLIQRSGSGKKKDTLKNLTEVKGKKSTNNFDNSSLCQPLEAFSDRNQALSARLAILDKLKKDNHFLFT